MISVTRAWLAFAAIGAGMIHLALVVSSPLPFAIAPALLGLAELGWGVAVLARSAVPRPLVALFLALAAAAGSVFAAALLDPAPAEAGVVSLSSPALPLLLAAALDGAVALLLAGALMIAHRRPSPLDAPSVREPQATTSRDETPSTRRILSSLAAIAAGALAVGAITTPALAASEAGRHARPHGEHVLPAPQDPKQHAPAGGHEGH